MVNSASCLHRTVNYITHTLPQQCLTTTRSAGLSTVKTEKFSPSDTSSQASDILTSATDSAIPRSASTQNVEGEIPENEASAIAQPSTSIREPEEEADSEADSGSPLGNGHFLSFEEWKKQNLGKYGQSSDQIGKPKQHENLQPRRQPINVLDSLGDDAEIDLEFTTFASEKPQIAVPIHKAAQASEASSLEGKEVPRPKSMSKDASTTFKDRFNYASFDCAATILKTNAKSSGSSSILVENKDSYMLNECSMENKFIVLELCEDILIDTIVLANYEFFSSIFRSFRVSVSDRYPVKKDKWKVLGTFEARNTREVQPFLVVNPLIWTRYVQIEFLTHYGNEFYCPLSLVRVHGTTMLEDYRHDEDSNKSEDRDEDVELILDDPEQIATESETPQSKIVASSEEGSAVGVERDELLTAEAPTADLGTQPSHRAQALPHPANDSSDIISSIYLSQSQQHTDFGLSWLLRNECPVDRDAKDKPPVGSGAHHAESLASDTTSPPGHLLEPTEGAADGLRVQQASTDPSRTKADRYPPELGKEIPSEDSSIIKQSIQPTNSFPSTKSRNFQSSDGAKQPASSTQPSPPNPTIQESFFKSVQKRLQMLETNSTLSLQYIEEQSRILRDAFSKVEQRQLSKTTIFLDYLNGTVLKELRDFRQQYDHLWQSTVIELETQREQNQREVMAINNRLGILADEIVFQKRMAVLQTILVLICIGLVLFSRGTVNAYLEHPLLQNMLTRSATLKMKGSFFETPSMSPESTRPNSSYKSLVRAPPYTRILKTHRRGLSEDSQDGAENPAIAYSPPTPASYDEQSETEDRDDEPISRMGSPVEDANEL